MLGVKPNGEAHGCGPCSSRFDSYRTLMKRAARKNSVWQSKRKNPNGRPARTVRIVASGKDRPHGDIVWRFVMFTDLPHERTGGVMHESDFRENYEWVRGRA